MGLCYSEPDKIVFKSGDPIELNDRQSAETSKDESPATNGEDSVAKPLKGAEELPSVTPTSTSVMDPMKGIEFDHGMCSCGHALRISCSIYIKDSPGLRKTLLQSPNPYMT